MSGWKRCKGSFPCPVCGDAKQKCIVSPDGKLCFCLRVEEGGLRDKNGNLRRAKNGMGTLHGLDKKTSARMRAASPNSERADKLNITEVRELLAHHKADLTQSRLQDFALATGLSERSLKAFGIGYDVEHRVFTFPMMDHMLRPIGIRWRSADGKLKMSQRGSTGGIFIPSEFDFDPLPEALSKTEGDDFPLLLLLPEGPTSACAAMDLGFRAIGRTSNMGGSDIIAELLKSKPRQDVVIVTDDDGVRWTKPVSGEPRPFFPGKEGGMHLAQMIMPYCGTLRMLKPPEIDGHICKDVRDFIREGGTGAMLLALIRSTTLVTPQKLKGWYRALDGMKKKLMAERKKQEEPKMEAVPEPVLDCFGCPVGVS